MLLGKSCSITAATTTTTKHPLRICNNFHFHFPNFFFSFLFFSCDHSCAGQGKAGKTEGKWLREGESLMAAV